MAGAFPRPDGGDLVQVVTSNKGNNKIDSFLHRSLDYDLTYDPSTGATEGTLRVTLRNDAPSSGLPPAVIGSNDQGLAPGTNLSFVSLYTPLGLRTARLDDQEAGLEFQHELGWSVYSTYVTIPPGASRTIELRLFGTLEPRETYRLLVRAQPVVNPDEVHVRVHATGGWELARARGLTVDPGRDGAGTQTSEGGDLPVEVTFARP